MCLSPVLVTGVGPGVCLAGVIVPEKLRNESGVLTVLRVPSVGTITRACSLTPSKCKGGGLAVLRYYTYTWSGPWSYLGKPRPNLKRRHNAVPQTSKNLTHCI